MCQFSQSWWSFSSNFRAQEIAPTVSRLVTSARGRWSVWGDQAAQDGPPTATIERPRDRPCLAVGSSVRRRNPSLISRNRWNQLSTPCREQTNFNPSVEEEPWKRNGKKKGVSRGGRDRDFPFSFTSPPHSRKPHSRSSWPSQAPGLPPADEESPGSVPWAAKRVWRAVGRETCGVPRAAGLGACGAPPALASPVGLGCEYHCTKGFPFARAFSMAVPGRKMSEFKR